MNRHDDSSLDRRTDAGHIMPLDTAKAYVAQIRTAFDNVSRRHFTEANLFRIKHLARDLADDAERAGDDAMAHAASMLRDAVEQTFPVRDRAQLLIRMHIDAIDDILVAQDMTQRREIGQRIACELTNAIDLLR